MIDTVLDTADSGRRELLAVAGTLLKEAAACHAGVILALRETRRHGLAERVSPLPGRPRRRPDPHRA